MSGFFRSGTGWNASPPARVVVLPVHGTILKQWSARNVSDSRTSASGA